MIFHYLATQNINLSSWRSTPKGSFARKKMENSHILAHLLDFARKPAIFSHHPRKKIGIDTSYHSPATWYPKHVVSTVSGSTDPIEPSKPWKIQGMESWKIILFQYKVGPVTCFLHGVKWK